MSRQMKVLLKDKIEENLLELFAKNIEDAREDELYIAIAKTLRLLIGRSWNKRYKEGFSKKRLYVMSFEYSLGTRLVSNSIKLGVLEDLKEILKERNRDFFSVAEQEIESQLGFGDLGLVSSSMLDGLASLNQNSYAYGLRYRKGMLKQEIREGKQVEKADDWKVYKNPWEHEKSFSHIVKLKDRNLKAIPYDVPIIGNNNENVTTLRLWKSESTEDVDFKLFSKGLIHESYKHINDANSVVEFLYPQEDSTQGKLLRFTQEYFFASASIQDILKKYKKYTDNDIRKFSERVCIQLNDIHPVISQLIFIDEVIKRFNLNLKEAIKLCQETFIFINSGHLEENFEKWDKSLIEQVCPDLIDLVNEIDKQIYIDISKCTTTESLNHLYINGKTYWEMVNIAYYLSHIVFIIGDDEELILKKKILPYHFDVYGYKIKQLQIGFNSGIYLEETNLDLYNLSNNKSKDEVEKSIYEIKKNKKEELLTYLDISPMEINSKSIFVMNLGVFHEYKRQLLSALNLALIYFRLKKNSNVDMPEITFFYGGKSYPNYYFAKEIISFINALKNLINNDFSIKNKLKIVFVENYNIKKSYKLIPASDLYEHLTLPDTGDIDLETYKFMVNGSMVITSKNKLYLDFVQENKSGKMYTFSKSIKEILDHNDEYYVYDYLNQNREIRDMIEFYRYQPKEQFPFNIDSIIDTLTNYNDGFKVLKDLLEYNQEFMAAIKSYMDRPTWDKHISENIYYSLNHSMNNAIEINTKNYWRSNAKN